MSSPINNSDHLIHSRDLSRIDALFSDIEKQCKGEDDFEELIKATYVISQYVQNFLNSRNQNLTYLTQITIGLGRANARLCNAISELDSMGWSVINISERYF